MQISSKNFMASQALYGLMISRPRMPKEQMVDEAYEYAELMMKRSKKKITHHASRITKRP